MTLIYDPSMAPYYVTVKARGMGTNTTAIMETTSAHSTVSRYCTVNCTALYILNKLYTGPADRVLLYLRLHQPAGPGGASRGGGHTTHCTVEGLYCAAGLAGLL